MSARSRAGSNTAYISLKVFFASLFGLVQMMIFTRFLGLEAMGLLQALRGLSSLLVALFLFGLPNVAMRFIPQLETRGERRRIVRLSSLLLGGILAAFILTVIVAWWGRGRLAGRFGVATDLLPEVLLLALSMGLAEFFYAFFQGLRRMAPVALAELLGVGVVTAQLYLQREGLDAHQVLHLLAISFFLRCVVLIVLIPRALPAERVNTQPLRVSKRDFLDYFGLSIVLRWLAMAYLDIDRYIIGLVGQLDQVALFHVPAKLVGLTRSFLAAPSLSLQTEVSRYYEERREAELPAHLQLFLRLQMAFTLWATGALFLLARPLILLMSTARYLEALPLQLLLLLVLPLTSLAAPMEAAFRGLHGLKVIFLGNMIWALAYFGSMPWLMHEYGLLGLGLAQLGASILQVAWVLSAAGRRGWLRGLGASLPGNLLWSSLPLAPALILALLLPGRQGLSPGGAGIVLGLALITAGALLLLAGRRLFDDADKQWLMARLPGRSWQRAAQLLLRVRATRP